MSHIYKICILIVKSYLYNILQAYFTEGMSDEMDWSFVDLFVDQFPVGLCFKFSDAPPV